MIGFVLSAERGATVSNECKKQTGWLVEIKTREQSPGGQIILATTQELVRDSSGPYKLGWSLLDSYSQVNFITGQFA